MGTGPVSARALRPRDARVAKRLRAIHQEMVDAVLSGAGIEPVARLAADALGRPVAIVVPAQSLAVLWPPSTSNDPLPALGRYMADEAGGGPPGVELVLPISSDGDVLGAVAMLAGVGSARMEAGELHLAALATLTGLALGQAREHEAARLAGDLIEGLRNDDVDTAAVIRRASRVGCDLTKGAVVLITEVRSNRPRQAMALIAAQHPGGISELLDGRIYALLPACGGDKAPGPAAIAAGTLAERLRSYGPTGISSFCPDPAELHRAIKEAELVLEIVSRDERMTEQLNGGLGSSVYRLLFRALASHPEELRSFYEDTVAPLVRYDHQYNTDLLTTLEVYLANDCNMNATGRAIYAHRHTVAYRLQRAKELTQLDPLVSEDRERLGLGLKAYRIVAPTLPR